MKKMSKYDKMFVLSAGLILVLLCVVIYQIRYMTVKDTILGICDQQDKLVKPEQPVVLTGFGEYAIRCSKNISNLYGQSYDDKWWLNHGIG